MVCPVYFAVVTGQPPVSAITAIDGTGPAFRAVSDATRGAGPALQWTVGLVRDPTSGVLADRGTDSVLAIDPVSGDRTVLEAGTVTEEQTYQLAYDAAHRRILVSGATTISAVEVTTGARSLMSGSGQGGGGSAYCIASCDSLMTRRPGSAMVAVMMALVERGARGVLRGLSPEGEPGRRESGAPPEMATPKDSWAPYAESPILGSYSASITFSTWSGGTKATTTRTVRT